LDTPSGPQYNPSVLALGALLLAAVAVGVAAYALSEIRDLDRERLRLAGQVRALLQRVDGAERAAADAGAQVESTANLLVEKGLAEPEDLESRRTEDERGPGTVH
jgi:hypothetical protein